MARLFLLLLALVGTAHAATDNELLPADQAFQLATRADGGILEATWQIAPGYYLYRDKFRFESLNPDVRLKPPQYPSARTKQDPFFGATAIYTGTVGVRVPFEAPASLKQARLRITAQGCNEPVGVCYPPVTKELEIALSAAPTAASTFGTGSARGFAQTLGLVKDDAVVDPDKAFQVEATVIDASSIGVRFSINDCCYLYRDKTSIGVSTPAGLRLGDYQLPPGEVMTDEFFGRTEVYRGRVDLRVPLAAGQATSANLVLRVNYQGCSEKGVTICYPPTTREVPVMAVSLAGSGSVADTNSGAWWWAVVGAFAGGLLLTFTPCVLPMIPILSGVIVGAEGTRLTKLRGGLLSYTYVLGTALTYTTAGAIAGATGEQLQAYFQNVWAIGVFSAVLALLALSMFGLYELQVPASIQTLLHRHSSRMHQKAKGRRVGEFIGVFLLGAISALIIGACVAPVLAFTLGTAIATRDPWLGAAVMFALAHGQGVILVAIGISEGFLLPRAGPWMEQVKHVFGVMLLAVAIYLLGTLPEVPVLLLWGALFIVSAVYLGATQTLPGGASGWRYLQKGAGTLLLIWGVIALLGGFLGGRDVLSPLPLDRVSAILHANGSTPPAASIFQRVRSPGELDAALMAARRDGKPVLLDYYATWCTDCVRMERSTFLDARVREVIGSRFVALQVDLTSTEDKGASAIKHRFEVYGPPALLFFGADGQERRALRAYGYLSATELLNALAQL